MRNPVLKVEGQSNDNPAVGAEFPRMMYKRTDVEDRFMQTDANAKCGETYLVQNQYDGLLCATIVADTADEMEALLSDGWEVSPKAAHGIAEGRSATVTAKDARIAELEAMLAEREAEKRGPGRPKKEPVDAEL